MLESLLALTTGLVTDLQEGDKVVGGRLHTARALKAPGLHTGRFSSRLWGDRHQPHIMGIFGMLQALAAPRGWWRAAWCPVPPGCGFRGTERSHCPLPRIGRLSGVPETSLPVTWLEGLVSGTDEPLGTPRGAEQGAARSSPPPHLQIRRPGCVPRVGACPPGPRTARGGGRTCGESNCECRAAPAVPQFPSSVPAAHLVLLTTPEPSHPPGPPTVTLVPLFPPAPSLPIPRSPCPPPPLSAPPNFPNLHPPQCSSGSCVVPPPPNPR